MSRFPGPHLGSQKLSIARHIFRPACEACAGWQWWNYLEEQARVAGKKVLRVNCDETNLQRRQKPTRGLVVDPATARTPQLVKSDRSKLGSLTHLAFICDDSSIQPILPQLIVGNEATLRKRDMALLQHEVPGNVYLVRQKSSWVDSSLFIAALKWLREATKKIEATHQVVLLVDGAGHHLSDDVLRAVRRLNLWLCMVPRKLTWLLQPCDTHVFRRYKAFLNREVSKQLSRDSIAENDVISTLVRTVFEVVKLVLQGNAWCKAFDGNGYGADQQSISKRVLRICGLMEMPAIGNAWPSEEQFLDILPRRKVFNLDMLKPATAAAASRADLVVPVVGKRMSPTASGFGGAAPVRAYSVGGEGSAAEGWLADDPDSLADSWRRRLRPRPEPAASGSIPDGAVASSPSSSKACPLLMPLRRAPHPRRAVPRPRALPLARPLRR